MLETDKAKFYGLLYGMLSIKRIPLTDEGAEVWWLTMQDWDYDAFAKACVRVMKTCEFPSPKDFEDLKLATRTPAREIFQEVRKHCRLSLYQRGVKMAPEVESAVRAIGGWDTIAMHPTDTIHFLEKRFCEVYDAQQLGRDVVRDVPALGQDGVSDRYLAMEPDKVASIQDRMKSLTDSKKVK